MFIDGFGFRGYRAFTNFTEVAPLSKMTLLIGQNNVGKSAVLRFLTHHYATTLAISLGRPSSLGFEDLDRPRLGGDSPFEFGVAFRRDRLDYPELAKAILPRAGTESLLDKTAQRIERILLHPSFTLNGREDLSWFLFVARPDRDRTALKMQPERLEAIQAAMNSNEWSSLRAHRHPDHAGGAVSGWVQDIVEAIYAALNAMNPLRPVTLVPAIREVKTLDGADDDFSGVNLITRLAELESPEHNEQEQNLRFIAINRFVSSVLGEPDARLTIPASRRTINVHLKNDLVLPLEAVGTGVHELIILAVAATVLNDQILCLEEPEIHVHPVTQKKLVDYLESETTNQYIIATHSAHVLDTIGAAILHVTRRDDRSEVHVSATDADRFEICADLGYRASDLIQSNCVIWVEGPSDRIYLRHWLATVAPDLLEGIHYSIMFYGGRLLSHLTADDPAVDEFISLRRLNQQLAIVIDSDKSSAHKRLNGTKKRVVAEMDKGSGIAWVTHGREIENYVEPKFLASVINNLHKGVTIAPGDRFTNMTSYPGKDGKSTSINKVRVAHRVADEDADLTVLDLDDRIKDLANFIRGANGMIA